MPKITSHRIISGEHEYGLDLDFKEAAIMQDQVAFDITAKRRPVSGGEWVSETATLSFNFEERIALVSVRDEEIGRIDLNGIDIGPGTPAEQAWEMIMGAYEGSPIEEAIQMVQDQVRRNTKKLSRTASSAPEIEKGCKTVTARSSI